MKNFPPEEEGTIFDIGGGNGFVSVGLANAGFDVALLEPGKTGASNGKQRGLKNVICATTETAKLKQNSLSAVGLFDVIEHIENDLAFLQSIKKLVKIGARIYATVPSYNFLWSEEDVIAGHFRRYTLEDITQVVESAGFRIEFSSYIFRFLPVPIFLLRTLPYKMGFSKAGRSPKSITRDHAENSGAMSRILNSMLHREFKNLGNKRAMRFGGSCLIVARNSE